LSRQRDPKAIIPILSHPLPRRHVIITQKILITNSPGKAKLPEAVLDKDVLESDKKDYLPSNGQRLQRQLPILSNETAKY